MNKNPIRGCAAWGERTYDRKLPETKGSCSRSGGYALKASVLTQGDPTSRLKGRRSQVRSGKSAEAVVARNRSRAGRTP